MKATTLLIVAALLLVSSTGAHSIAPSATAVRSDTAPANEATRPEFCCCTPARVEEQAPVLLKILDRVVHRQWFRYFKANTHKDCDFWAASLLCTSATNPCALCTCDDDAIPQTLRTDADMAQLPKDFADAPLAPASTPQSKVTSWSISETKPSDFAQNDANVGSMKGGVFDAFAAVEQQAKSSETDPDAEYVDLVKNPEGNTGYVGPFAHRVWSAVYSENCVLDQPQKAPNAATQPVDTTEKTDEEGEVAEAQCTQFEALHKLVSGLHTSISSHIALSFNGHVDAAFNSIFGCPADTQRKSHSPSAPATDAGDDERSSSEKKQLLEKQPIPRDDISSVNCDEWRDRVLDHPDRIRNLHYTYQFVLRGVAKAKASIADLSLSTGDSDEDAGLHDDLQALLQSNLMCTSTFDEEAFLQTPEAADVVRQMRTKLMNMTKLLDCLTCQKCRLWGKLQFLGLATAFKFVMAPAQAPGAEPLPIGRNEAVALVNLLRQVTVSVAHLAEADRICPVGVGSGSLTSDSTASKKSAGLFGDL